MNDLWRGGQAERATRLLHSVHSTSTASQANHLIHLMASSGSGDGQLLENDLLARPPAVIAPSRQDFASELNKATRNLSLAHTHETSTSAASAAHRYELAYPLYLAAANGFLWACKNIQFAGIAPSSSNGEGSGGDRVTSLKDTFMRQAKKALGRAEKIKEVKGQEWAKRWAGTRALSSMATQADVVRASSTTNGMRFEPVPPKEPLAASHPLPQLSEKQVNEGAKFASAADLLDADCCRIVDPSRPLEAIDIVQDAVTNCGLVAAMEAIAQHDRRWQTSLLRRPLLNDADELQRGRLITVRIHWSGCPRYVAIDDQLPFHPAEEDNSKSRLLCASAPTLLPSLLEKAFLTILGTYAPAGSIPAIDLHALTGWLPEIVQIETTNDSASEGAGSFQREKTWQRLWRGLNNGSVLACAGTGNTSPRGRILDEGERNDAEMAGQGPLRLVPGHSYSILDIEIDPQTGQRQILLLNPWRPAPTSTSSFKLSWDDFCTHFSTLHLAWNPVALFGPPAEVFASWKHAGEGDMGSEDAQLGVIRNLNFTLKATAAKQATTADPATTEGAEEVWLHVSRSIKSTKSPEKYFIAIHIFEQAGSAGASSGTSLQLSRVIPIGGNRQGAGGVFVDTSHHLVRFRPSLALQSLISSEGPGLSTAPTNKDYNLVVSLHSTAPVPEDVNFTLRAWSRAYSVVIEDPEEEAAWSSSLRAEWTRSTAGGHLMSPKFYCNPQYLLYLPPNTPAGSMTLSLSTAPDLAVQILLVHSPPFTPLSNRPTRVDRVERGDIILDSGSYSYGLAKVKGTLPATTFQSGARYHLILSTYQSELPGNFHLQLQSPFRIQVASTYSSGIKTGVSLEPVPIEGAGLFAKKVKGRWSQSDGTAAGSPRSGRYEANPQWILRVGTAADTTTGRITKLAQFRLQVTSNNDDEQDDSTTPALNLSIFHRLPSSPFHSEIATTGPYQQVSQSGLALYDVRLTKGEEYTLVASTFESGWQGGFEIGGWCEEREWELKRV